MKTTLIFLLLLFFSFSVYGENDMNNLPSGMFTVGNKLMGRCGVCGKLVRIDKPIFGSIHFCLSDEERKEKESRGDYKIPVQNITDIDLIAFFGEEAYAKGKRCPADWLDKKTDRYKCGITNPKPEEEK